MRWPVLVAPAVACVLGLASTSQAQTTTVVEDLALLNTERVELARLVDQRPLAADAVVQLDDDIAAAATAVADAQARLDKLESVEAADLQRAADARQTVRNLARVMYLGGSLESADEVELGDQSNDATNEIYAAAIAERWEDALVEVDQLQASYDDERLEFADEVADAAAARDFAVSRRQTAEADLAALEAEITRLTSVIAEREARVVTVHAAQTVPGTDIPVIALVAYQRSAINANGLFPGCDLHWSHVAGIGRAESNHARFNGSQPRPDGRVLPVIRGIALDGTRSLAIADTDLGALDGDPIWDRAVGPTQFIPGTWRGYAAQFDLDGNGDGVEDPDNLLDQARATGIYLCRSGRGSLNDLTNFARAVHAYNPNDRYLTAVTNYAAVYGSLIVPDLSTIAIELLGTFDVPAAIPVDQLPPVIVDPASLAPPNVDQPLLPAPGTEVTTVPTTTPATDTTVPPSTLPSVPTTIVDPSTLVSQTTTAPPPSEPIDTTAPDTTAATTRPSSTDTTRPTSTTTVPPSTTASSAPTTRGTTTSSSTSTSAPPPSSPTEVTL
jgi:membrane-bound lytic murein transglycosylase B